MTHSVKMMDDEFDTVLKSHVFQKIGLIKTSSKERSVRHNGDYYSNNNQHKLV